MTTHLDYTVGIGKETTYGTAVAPTRFYESEAKMSVDIETVQGRGLRPTKRVGRGLRNSIAKVSVGGDIDVDVSDSGFGLLLEAVLGTPVIGAGGTGVSMHTYTLRKTDPAPSYTIEEVVPYIGGQTGSGPQKFVGCVAESITFEVSEGGYCTAKVTFAGKDMVLTGTATAATYPATDELLSAAAPQSGVYLAGSDIKAKSFSVTIKNNMDQGGYAIGGQARRTRKAELGKADITGSFTTDTNLATLRSRTLDRASSVLVLNVNSPRLISGVQLGISIELSAVKIKGGIPQSNGGGVPEATVEFEAFDEGAEPVTIYYTTPDNAV